MMDLYFVLTDMNTFLCLFCALLLILYLFSTEKLKLSSTDRVDIKSVKKTSGETTQLGYFRNSYTDLRRGLDSYSFYNVTPKYSRLPEEIIFLIENIKVFGHFDSKILLDLCYHIETKSLLAGEELCDACSASENIFVVQSGEIEVSVLSDQGKKNCIKKAKKGDAIFSLLNVLEKFAYGSSSQSCNFLSSVAIKDSVLLALPISALKEVLDKYPDSLIDVVKIIGFRLQRVTLFTLKTYFGLSSELLFESTQPANEENRCFRETSIQANRKLSDYQICFFDSSDSDGSCSCNTAYDESVCQMCEGKLNASKSRVCKVCFLKMSIEHFRYLLGLDDSLVPNAAIKQTHFHSGSNILVQGNNVDFLHLLVSGMVSIEEKCEEKHTLKQVGVYREGRFLGSLSVLTGEASIFTYTAVTDCILLSISAGDLFDTINKKPEIIVKLGANIIKDLTSIVRQVDFGLDWMQLEAGSILYKQGDVSDSAYVVLTGRLQSTSHHSARSMLTGEYGRGEIVGLAETLTQSLRGSNVMAIRDTELASLSEGLIFFIKHCHPDSVTSLVYLMGQKILKSLSGDNNIFSMISHFSSKKENMHLGKISTIALMSVSNSVQLQAFAGIFQLALNATEKTLLLHGDKVLKLLNSSSFETIPNYHLSMWLSQQEDQNDIVLYQCDNHMGSWTKKCVRQADCIMIIAYANESSSVRRLEMQLSKLPSRARKYLVLLHNMDEKRPKNTVEWLRVRPWCTGHFHLRCSDTLFSSSECDLGSCVTPDFYRIARILTNKAVGLVLGGGAARGCAHAGVIKAMLDADIPIDLVGGTSIGAMASAIWAMETDYPRFYSIFRDWSKNKLGSMLFLAKDITYPHTSFFTGSRFNKVIRETLGSSVAIEDLWIPFFCVTTNITVSESRVHTFGSLWRYVRASMSLAGYMPPLCDPVDGHLLLDGVYTNNLPANVMLHQMVGAKTIFAVDVGRVTSGDFSNYGDSLSGWWVLFSRIFPWFSSVKVPNMAEVQSRVGYVLCEKQLQDVKSGGYCEYIRPPIDKYGSLQFNKFDEIYQVGFDHAKSFFSQWKASKESNNDIKL